MKHFQNEPIKMQEWLNPNLLFLLAVLGVLRLLDMNLITLILYVLIHLLIADEVKLFSAGYFYKHQ